MMNKRYLVALDQGTTSSRAVVFTLEGHMVSAAAHFWGDEAVFGGR